MMDVTSKGYSNQVSETWVDLPGYEYYNQVSNRGRVRYRNTNPRLNAEWLSSPIAVNDETGLVRTRLNGGLWTDVAGLIARTFIGEISLDSEVIHLNGNLRDLRPENLVYATESEETRHCSFVRASGAAPGPMAYETSEPAVVWWSEGARGRAVACCSVGGIHLIGVKLKVPGGVSPAPNRFSVWSVSDGVAEPGAVAPDIHAWASETWGRRLLGCERFRGDLGRLTSHGRTMGFVSLTSLGIVRRVCGRFSLVSCESPVVLCYGRDGLLGAIDIQVRSR